MDNIQCWCDASYSPPINTCAVGFVIYRNGELICTYREELSYMDILDIHHAEYLAVYKLTQKLNELQYTNATIHFDNLTVYNHLLWNTPLKDNKKNTRFHAIKKNILSISTNFKWKLVKSKHNLAHDTAKSLIIEKKKEYNLTFNKLGHIELLNVEKEAITKFEELFDDIKNSEDIIKLINRHVLLGELNQTDVNRYEYHCDNLAIVVENKTVTSISECKKRKPNPTNKIKEKKLNEILLIKTSSE